MTFHRAFKRSSLLVLFLTTLCGAGDFDASKIQFGPLKVVPLGSSKGPPAKFIRQPDKELEKCPVKADDCKKLCSAGIDTLYSCGLQPYFPAEAFAAIYGGQKMAFVLGYIRTAKQSLQDESRARPLEDVAAKPTPQPEMSSGVPLKGHSKLKP